MVSATVSKGPGGPDGGTPRATFHVAPPPPPRPKTWKSELAIALTLALLFNLLVIASFLLLAPDAPSREEPPSITVELVQEPKPEPQPEPEPQPQPQEEAAQERTFTRSGATDDPSVPGYGEEPAEEEPVEAETQPEEKPAEKEQKAEKEDLPGWARTVEEGYDLNAGNQGASSAEQQLAKASGGDAYLNAMGRRIVANVVYPEEARGREGILVIVLLVHRTGRLEQFRVLQSTGDPALDRAALAAIQRSVPFAPFPAGITVARAPLQLTLKISPQLN
ncbi:TonB family protein [Parvibaculum sp.]|uniref:energy transducer TonB n=1 Tax=Parvibaculum sp. TaxID=2024848 RepID=UPI001B114301|nr:TonB family protein [Parvibaculum sp.]MBO6635332.1 energy transducer TonB [Parvibaculum sp.]MBO6678843.1 energy transducer TonB [Parvibaculum sp.]MBO6683747.1 energy transducer TonB [Parvibaculum sp.]